ncbi:hypothetical protein I907_gp47 [Bacillus phage Eoghan]|uniref:Uncharacterized protein n=2 Tax=Andromedavirus TaxID=1623275 RepID=M1IQL6_9CAUD|nr:hypothetical protein I907_gp47 [Bacillus phage Eoghan]YP_009592280.1 hypothetical protein FDG68_gp47 [Bacillus phage Taylor]AGE60811.1 hypothetical protein EOGHAN_48 [Bacillus phage Eoghan]AGE60965.1 hypothetical protein TAYLOR_47 [Bacillus phage Taylor]
MSCYHCKHAKDFKDLPRTGEQVRCAKAEEMFGGERWVDVRRSEKTGKLLKPKCGQYENAAEEILSMSRSQSASFIAKKMPLIKCTNCHGKGKLIVNVGGTREYSTCGKCHGRGGFDK